MYKIILALLSLMVGSQAVVTSNHCGPNPPRTTYVGNHSGPVITPMNNCVSFSVSSGTGCAWMCTYCANSLGTNNYYFTDSVCTYQSGGCVGNPLAGKTYTCCSV
jgi:hypothetical protein